MGNPVWNWADLLPPPTVECSYVNGQDKLPFGLIREANSTLVEAYTTLTDQKLLCSEYFLLERSLYRAKNSLGRNKFMQQLKMVQKCAKRYINMKLHVSIGELQNCWKVTSYGPGNKIHHLASRQMLEYILVKLMGAGQLLLQTMGHCVKSYTLCDQQLKQELHIPNQVVFLSIVSRIWVLCRTLMKQICKWYNKLQGVHPHLKGTQVEWLPDGTEIPQDLQIWLGPEPGNINLSPDSSSSIVVDKFKAVRDNINKGSKVVKDEVQHEKKECVTEITEDLGLPVLRSECVTGVTEDLGLPVIRNISKNGSDQTPKKNKQQTKQTLNKDMPTDETHVYGLLDVQYWREQVQACTTFSHIWDCFLHFKGSVGCKQTWFHKRKEKLQRKERKFDSLKGRPKAQKKMLSKASTLLVVFLSNYLLKKNKQGTPGKEIGSQFKNGNVSVGDSGSKAYSASKRAKLKKSKKKLYKSGYANESTIGNDSIPKIFSPQVQSQQKLFKVVHKTELSQGSTIKCFKENKLSKWKQKKSKKKSKQKREEKSQSYLASNLSKKLKSSSKHKKRTR